MLATKVFRSAQPLKNVSICPEQSFNPHHITSLNGLRNILPLISALTIYAPTEPPPLCITPRPRQHRLLQQRHLWPSRRRWLTRRWILLLSNHRTQTRSACSSLSRRTQDRALLSRSLGLRAAESLPRRRPRLHRFEARVRGGNKSQYEKIPLCASQQR